MSESFLQREIVVVKTLKDEENDVCRTRHSDRKISLKVKKGPAGESHVTDGARPRCTSSDLVYIYQEQKQNTIFTQPKEKKKERSLFYLTQDALIYREFLSLKVSFI